MNSKGRGRQTCAADPTGRVPPVTAGTEAHLRFYGTTRRDSRRADPGWDGSSRLEAGAGVVAVTPSA